MLNESNNLYLICFKKIKRNFCCEERQGNHVKNK